MLAAKGPGVYFAEENVPATDIRISPDGEHALVHHANQLYLVALLNTHLQDVTVDVLAPALPLARLTDFGDDHLGRLTENCEDLV